MSRINVVCAVVGNRGTGKTDYGKSLVRAAHHKKKLIVDTFDSPPWHNLETHNFPEGKNIPIGVIQLEHLPHWQDSGIYRIFGSDTDSIMSGINSHVRNTLIVFEDATKYVGTKLSEDMRRFVLDSKQKNLDLIFVFHTLSKIPKELIHVLDYLTIFKTGEQYDSFLKRRFPPAVEKSFYKVNNSPSKYHNETISISG